MKKLITAETVRLEHAAGHKRIEVPLPQTIVTAEARSLAEQLGVELAETVQGFVAKVSATAGPQAVGKFRAKRRSNPQRARKSRPFAPRSWLNCRRAAFPMPWSIS